MQKNPNISSENSEKEVQGHHEALYDRFVERARELFDAGQEKSKETMEKAMERRTNNYPKLGSSPQCRARLSKNSCAEIWRK